MIAKLDAIVDFPADGFSAVTTIHFIVSSAEENKRFDLMPRNFSLITDLGSCKVIS